LRAPTSLATAVRALVALSAMPPLTAACGSEDVDARPPVPDAGRADSGRTTVGFTDTRHTFPAIDLAPGEDKGPGQRDYPCQSWTLNNDEPLYVNSVRFIAGPGWHHSNWLFVPETMFPGDDGTWNCRDRAFTEAAAAAGGVFFAQSTQAEEETQRFPPGAAYVIPPRSKIVGGIHLINFSGAPVSTDVTFELGLIPEAEVTTILEPISLNLQEGFRVPASSTAVLTMDCPLPAAVSRGFRIFYVLPHYHQYATRFRFELTGGTRDGEPIYETSASIGDPLGAMLEVPVDTTGATGLRMTCAYDNTETFDLLYLNSDEGEMCVLLAYTDAGYRIYGASVGAPRVSSDGSTSFRESECEAYAIRPPRWR
jgi:hypothetical protein